MSKISIRRWFWVHKWTSLISTVFMLIACVTGLPLIFHHEIHVAEEWLAGSNHSPSDVSKEMLTVDKIVAAASDARPNLETQLIFRQPVEPDITIVGMGKTVASPLAESELLRFNHYSGNMEGAEQIGEGVMGFLTMLHVELLGGTPGSLFLGVMAMIFVVSIISGVVLYAPFMRNRSFAVIRRDRGRRTKWLDLHNGLGIVILAWLLVVSVTGIINTWGTPLIQFWLMTEMKSLTATDMKTDVDKSRGLTSLQNAVNIAQKELPGDELSFVMFPGSELSSDRHYLVFFRGTDPVSSRLMKATIVNGYTGELVATSDMPLYMKVFLLSQPLHFGDYGGIGLKIVWAVLDIATIILLWSGLILWWRKKGDQPIIETVCQGSGRRLHEQY